MRIFHSFPSWSLPPPHSFYMPTTSRCRVSSRGGVVGYHGTTLGTTGTTRSLSFLANIETSSSLETDGPRGASRKRMGLRRRRRRRLHTRSSPPYRFTHTAPVRRARTSRRAGGASLHDPQYQYRQLQFLLRTTSTPHRLLLQHDRIPSP